MTTVPGRLIARPWCAALTLFAALVAGCGARWPLALGQSVEAARAVPLARLMARGDLDGSPEVVVSGRVAEVCRSAGCWLVLDDAAAGKSWQLLIDLKRGAFTVPAAVVGRQAMVAGTMRGHAPDLSLDATGLVVK